MRKVLVVLGMHRSGTSALAGTLIDAGAKAPRTPMPASPDNPLGYWESLPIVHWHDALLDQAGLSWDSWDTGIDERVLQACSSEDQAHLDALIDREYGAADLPLIKDPRLSLLLKLWLPALARRGDQPHMVLMSRSPLEVALSLHKRDGIEITAAVLMWLRYTLLGEQHSRAQKRSFVNFEALLHDPDSCCARLATQLDLPLRRTTQGRSPVQASLRHQQSADFSLIPDAALRAIAAHTWDTMQALAEQDSAPLRAQLDRQLQALDRLLQDRPALRPRRFTLSSVERLPAAAVRDFNIEAPVKGARIANGRLHLSGWLLGQDAQHLDSIVLDQGGQRPVQQIEIWERPDVAAAFPDCAWALRCGFRINASMLPVSGSAFTLRLSVAAPGADAGSRLPLAQLLFTQVQEPATCHQPEAATHAAEPADEALSALDRAAEALPADDIAGHLRLAVDYRDRQAFARGEQLLQRVLDRHPLHQGAATALALSHRKQGDRAQAAALFLRLSERYPGMPRLRLEASVDLQALGRFAEARQQLSAFLAQEPAHFDGRLRMAQVQRELGEHEAAIRQLQELQAEQPDTIAVLVPLMQALHQLERNAQCEPVARHLLRLQPDNLAGLTTLARLLMIKGEQDAAVQLWSAAAARNPNSAIHQQRYAETLAAAAHSQHASEQWRSRLQQSPHDPDLLVAAALFARRTGNRLQAMMALRRACALSPERPRLRFEYARERLHQGHLKTAARLLAAEQSTEPDVAELRLMFAQLQGPQQVQATLQKLRADATLPAEELRRLMLRLELVGTAAELEALAAATDTTGIDGLLNQAELQFRLGHNHACRAALQQAVDIAHSGGLQQRRQVERLCAALHHHGLAELYDRLIQYLQRHAPKLLNDEQIVRQLASAARPEPARQWLEQASERMGIDRVSRVQIELSIERRDFEAADVGFAQRTAQAGTLVLPDLLSWLRVKIERDQITQARELLRRHARSFHFLDLAEVQAELAGIDMQFEAQSAILERAYRRNPYRESLALRWAQCLIESGQYEAAEHLVRAWEGSRGKPLDWMRMRILLSFHTVKDWAALLACVHALRAQATAPDRQALQATLIHYLMLSAQHEHADQELDQYLAATEEQAIPYAQKCWRRIESAARLMQLARHSQSQALLASLRPGLSAAMHDPYHRLCAASAAHQENLEQFVLHNAALRDPRHRVTVRAFTSDESAPVPPLRTAVLLHLYYLDLWPQLLRYLESLQGTSFQLFVSTSPAELEGARALVLQRYPDAQLRATENRGFDVGSHWQTLQSVDLRQFDVVLLLQSKKSTHVRIGDSWRDHLMSSLLGSAHKWRDNLRAFADEPKLGMLGCAYHRNVVDLLYCPEMRQTLRLLGMPTDYESLKDYQEFVGGTILMMRASLLREMHEKTAGVIEFEPYERLNLAKRRDATYAHAMERALGFYVRWRGYHSLWRP